MPYTRRYVARRRLRPVAYLPGTKAIQKISLSGTIASSGGLVRQVNLNLSGAVATLTGSLVKLVSTRYSGAIASIVGTLVKVPQVSFSGAISSIVGTLANVKTTFLSVSGGITPTGALVKQANVNFSGAISSIQGSLSRVVSTAFTGSVTSAGALTKIVNKIMAGTEYRAMIMATTGLLGYWRLGESSGTTAVDETHTTDGTYVGAPTLSQPGITGAVNNTAVTFDGLTQYVDLGTTAAIRPANKVSAEMWFKTTVSGGMLYSSSTSGYGFNVFLTGGQIRFETDTSVSGIISFVSDATGLDNGAWHHVVCTYDGSVKKIYIDGDLQSTTQSASGTLNYGTGNNAIAVYPDLVSYFFTDTLDEVAIYNTDLSPSTVQQHYQAGAVLRVAMIAPAGALVKRVNKLFDGAIPSISGTLSKLASVRFSGSITSIVGTVSKIPKISFSGSISSSGAVATVEIHPGAGGNKRWRLLLMFVS